MEEDTVIALPRPGSSVTDDPLLAVLREGARRMLTQASETEVEHRAPGLVRVEEPELRVIGKPLPMVGEDGLHFTQSARG